MFNGAVEESERLFDGFVVADGLDNVHAGAFQENDYGGSADFVIIMGDFSTLTVEQADVAIVGSGEGDGAENWLVAGTGGEKNYNAEKGKDTYYFHGDLI